MNESDKPASKASSQPAKPKATGKRAASSKSASQPNLPGTENSEKKTTSSTTDKRTAANLVTKAGRQTGRAQSPAKKAYPKKASKKTVPKKKVAVSTPKKLSPASDAVADLNGDQVPLHPMRIWPD